MKKISSVQFSVLLLFLLLGIRTVSACSCGAKANVLDSFESATNVVVITALAVQKSSEGSGVDGVRSTRMVVDKVYKGQLKKGDEITFGQGGGADCIWTFNEKSIGKSYLFYLPEGTKDSMWIGFGCGRSTLLENASEDLKFLENLNKVRNRTRISGTVNFDYAGPLIESILEGIKIRVVGSNKTYELVTDKNGVYEIYGVPAGRYRIIPEVPCGWKVSQFYLEYNRDLITDRDEDDDAPPILEYWIELEDKRHSSVDFRFELDNAFRGKIYDPSGNVMKGVCVRLYPPSGITKDFPYIADCTESDGAFELDEVPPGSYIIVANDGNEISASEPFRTIYYPGVFELEKAAVLVMGLGEIHEGMDIRVPSTEELVTVTGRLLYSDGKPVADATLKFTADNKKSGVEDESQTRTDENGNFSLRVLKGLNGTIVGSMYAYIGKFENCPKLEAIIKATGNTIAEVSTNRTPINGAQDVSDVNLTFSFPSCEKAKE